MLSEARVHKKRECSLWRPRVGEDKWGQGPWATPAICLTPHPPPSLGLLDSHGTFFLFSLSFPCAVPQSRMLQNWVHGFSPHVHSAPPSPQTSQGARDGAHGGLLLLALPPPLPGWLQRTHLAPFAPRSPTWSGAQPFRCPPLPTTSTPGG